MSARPKASSVQHIQSETPDVVTPLPLLACATFCDDVRLEASGKLCIVGCYPGNVILTNPDHPVTQLWVFARLTWRGDFDPTGLRLRLDLPAQGTGYMDIKPNPVVSEALARDAVCVWQLRLLPLRVGDLLRVSVEKGSAKLPCGELLAVEATQATRH